MEVLQEHVVDHAGAKSMVQAELATMWSLPAYIEGRFPCNNPCSIMRSDLPKLHKFKYTVGEKTDGVRMYLLLGWLPSRAEPYAFLIDRACRLVGVTLSLRVPPSYYDGSLFDGELVTNASGGFDYVVFDCVTANGLEYKAQHHSTRMRMVARAFEDGVFNFQPPLDTIIPRVKVWLPLNAASASLLLPVVARDEADGVILVRENAPLRLGMQTDMYKWKPVDKHTVDFLWDGHSLLLRDKDALVTPNHITLEHAHLMALPRNSVVECCFTTPYAPWVARVVKVRTDKTEPNSVHVAELTLQNIQEHIGFEELFFKE